MWRDFLNDSETRVLPWTGGRTLRYGARAWSLEPRPSEHGWYSFRLARRAAEPLASASPNPEVLTAYVETGYLVGDRLVPPVRDLGQGGNDVLARARGWPRVHLLEPGERFNPITVGRTAEGAPLVYMYPAFGAGPEDDVRQAYEERRTTLEGIKHVPPGLRAAFEAAVALRDDDERRRREAERDTGRGRRQLAQHDFAAAAACALAVSGARYLDHRLVAENEYAVRFQFLERRFECTCDTTLQIISAGICLTASYDDGHFREGTKGDTWLTLESLPAVIREADRESVLVQYRR